jgi:hypothetical protein
VSRLGQSFLDSCFDAGANLIAKADINGARACAALSAPERIP